MTRKANYFTIYFSKRIGEVSTLIKDVIGEFFEMAPKTSLGHAGKMPCNGTYKKSVLVVREKALSLLERAATLGEEDDVFLSFKDGKARDFSSSRFHLHIFGRNLIHVPSQKTTLPNFIQCFFPRELPHEEQVKMIDWFESITLRVEACYAYMNPVVDYDMFHANKVVQDVLELLKNDMILDVFDDFNHSRCFLDQIKSPMWINVLSSTHMKKLGAFVPPNGVSKKEKGDLTFLYIESDWSEPDQSVVVSQYSALARSLVPITLASFSPISFRFPYKYPKKYSDIWLRRFLTPEWSEFTLPMK